MGVECRICMADPSNVILVPCHHLSICYNCFSKMKSEQKNQLKCPICRHNFAPDAFMLVHNGGPLGEAPSSTS